jgi:hypothetical protein
LVFLAFAFALAISAPMACNQSETADCPTGTIQPGGSCSDDQLQCAYSLSTPSAACDGTSTVIPSSCTCTSGSWACPSPFECGDSGTTEDGAAPDAGEANEAGPSLG